MIFDVTRQCFVDGSGVPCAGPEFSLSSGPVVDWYSRDFEGYYQSREGESGEWEFYVSGFFGDDQASVLRYDRSYESVAIDAQDRIKIAGRWWGRAHWNH